MTREDKLKAFALRDEGKTWDEIGEAIHYSSVAVRRALQQVISGKHPKPIKYTVVYPNIKAVIEEKCDGRMALFVEKIHVTREWGYKVLSGKATLTDEMALLISDTFGLTLGEVFYRGDPNDKCRETSCL